jgi:hypothetical protein
MICAPIKISSPAINGLTTGALILKKIFKIIDIPKAIRKEPSKKSNNICCLSQQNGVNSGARTHDPQNHNLVLYQLSYAHHHMNYIKSIRVLSQKAMLKRLITSATN